MELIQLRYFVTIAETMSFTAAAELLHVSQPALSYQIKRLEVELGTLLFDRTSRRISLSPDGEVFLPLAQAVLYRADEAVRILQEHLGVEVGEVRVGCNPSVSTYLFPGVLAAFHKAYPRVRVEIVEGGDQELQQSVQQGALEFAIVTAPGSPRTLDVAPLGSEGLMIIAPLTHPLAGRDSIELGALAHEDFVLATNAFNLTTYTIDACRRAGFEPRVVYRAGSVEAVKNLVRQGLGVSIMPEMALKGSGKESLAVMTLDGGMERELNLILGKDRSITRAAEALMSQVRVSLGGLLRQPQPAETADAGPADASQAATSGTPAGTGDTSANGAPSRRSAARAPRKPRTAGA